MTWFIICFILLGFIYLRYILLLRMGLLKMIDLPPANQPEPGVSIIVAAKDEETFIERCLESLAKIEYPPEKIEFIIVNDRSTDQTPQMIESFVKKHPRFHVIHLNEPGSGDGMIGKARAIASAIKQSVGEIIFLTDADCEVPSTWVRGLVSHYDEQTGLVCSLTVLDKPGENVSWFVKGQSLYWIYLLSVGAGMAGLERPLSCIGNNFTFRRKTYEEVGGYENIPFSVTEDLLLFKTIARKTRWKIKFPVDEKTLVISDPSPDWKSFFLQQKRWALGGFDLSWNGLAIIFASYFFHIFLFAGFFLFPGVSLVVFLFKIACDAWLISPAIRKIKRGDYWVYFWAFQTIYYVQALVLQMILLWNRKVIWKGRKY